MTEIQQYTYDEVSHRLEYMIKNKQSFVLRGLTDRMGEAIAKVEETIEKQQLTCRVYSRNRAAIVAATAWVPVLSWANAAALVVHNLVTMDPDYEIGKDLIDKRLHVTYKR